MNFFTFRNVKLVGLKLIFQINLLAFNQNRMKMGDNLVNESAFCLLKSNCKCLCNRQIQTKNTLTAL